MQIPFFKRIKSSPSAQPLTASVAQLTTPHDIGIQELKTEEYGAVSGGPEVENEPD